MDVKRQYLDVLIEKVNHCFDTQLDKIKKVSQMFGECMDNKGIVQLFGVKHGIEFVNELNYRAGGIALFHKNALGDLVTRKVIERDDLFGTGSVYDDVSNYEKLAKLYKYDDRDMWVIISENGNEPLALEFAKRAKEKGQKVVAVISEKAYKENGGTLLEYADEYLDMQGDYPDLTLDIEGTKVGQTVSTVADIMAQMITAELYAYFIEKHGEAPVLLSANIKGADEHNDAITDPYEGRIH